jgi:hypothetical protein
MHVAMLILAHDHIGAIIVIYRSLSHIISTTIAATISGFVV